MASKLTRQVALMAGAAAIVGMGALSACSTTKEKPAETTAPSKSSSAPSPTEKAVGGGANSFSPTAKARPAPTALPGNVVTGG